MYALLEVAIRENPENQALFANESSLDSLVASLGFDLGVLQVVQSIFKNNAQIQRLITHAHIDALIELLEKTPRNTAVGAFLGYAVYNYFDLFCRF